MTVPDAIASNGVVHVIGDVLFPVPVGNVFDVLDNCTSFSKFKEYIIKAGLQDELKNAGTVLVFMIYKVHPQLIIVIHWLLLLFLINTLLFYKIAANPITLFAPTNDAFDFLPSRVKDILENADGRRKLFPKKTTSNKMLFISLT